MIAAAVALAGALAAQLSIVAHGPAVAAACEPVEVSVAVSAPGTVAPRVLIPPLAPFELLRTTARPHVRHDASGRPSIMVEHKYVITTDRVGSFTLPPFEAHAGGAVVRSRPLRLDIRPTPEEGSAPAVVTRAQIDTSVEVNFRALALPETVYVGQQANYEVAVFLSETVRDRLRRNPTFFPPDMQSMLAYDLPVVKGEPPRRRVGRRCFDALVYQRAVFPLMAGRFVVPPAQLVYSLALTPGFFSREETHELRTDSAVIVAVDPPAAFRPADYTGAVGALRVFARVDTAAGRVGDPITLSVRVEGTGNVKLFPRPTLAIPWGTLVAAEERVRVDTAARRIRGSKEFDWILTPHRAGELEIPAVRYTFFNPDGRRYETALAPPLRVSIAPGLTAAADTVVTDRAPAIRTRYRGPVAPPLYAWPAYWLLLAAAPIPALLLGARTRTSARPRTVDPARELRAVAAARPPANARALRRAFTAALEDRLAVHVDAFSRGGALDRVLRHAGVPAALAGEAERFLRRLDEAAYAAGGALPEGAGRRALDLYRRIDAQAVRPWEVPSGSRALLATVLLGGLAGAAAAAPESPRALFEAGVRAYTGRQYADAQRAFGGLARREPRAPDAWANFGTASWVVRDTARAVAGWQRALRLEPLARDVRARLEEVRPETIASAAFVPPVTPSGLAVALACCWWGAWLAGAVRVRRGAGSRTPVVVLGAATVLVALAAVHQVERLAARDLVVVRAPGPLTVSPALGADGTAHAGAGEVGRVRAVHGVWSRVTLDGGRQGWIESSRLISLAAPPVD